MKEILGWLIIYAGVMWLAIPAILGGFEDIAESYIGVVKITHLIVIGLLIIVVCIVGLGKLLYWCFS
jgi:hypothetical protein